MDLSIRRWAMLATRYTDFLTERAYLQRGVIQETSCLVIKALINCYFPHTSFPKTILNAIPQFFALKHLLREECTLIKSTKDSQCGHKQITFPRIADAVPYCRYKASTKASLHACF